MPIRLLPTMAKNDHAYPATRILANGHTLVIASEGNNRIGMVLTSIATLQALIGFGLRPG